MSREIKFRAWNKRSKIIGIIMYMDFDERPEIEILQDNGEIYNDLSSNYEVMQYTGLKDKNGAGLIEVYEGDIISVDGKLKGNIYEVDARNTDLTIPQLGTKAWEAAYKEAVVRGYDYSE